MRGIVDQADIALDFVRGPAPLHQLFAGLRRISRTSDGRDHLIHIRHRNGETTEDVAPLACLPKFVCRAPSHDLFTEVDEVGQEVPQRELLGPAAVEGQHVAAEGRLHGCEAPKLVQHDVRRRIPLQFDHHSDADPVALIGDARDAFDLLFAHQIGDLLDHRGLVDLKRDLVEHDGEAVLADFLDARLCADDHAATPFEVGFPRA